MPQLLWCSQYFGCLVVHLPFIYTRSLSLSLSLSRFFSVRFAVYHIRDRERDVLFCSSPKVKKLQLLLRVSVNPLSLSVSCALVPLQFYNIFFLTKEKVIKFVKKAIICLNMLIFFSIFFPHRFLWFIYIDKVSLMPLPSLFFSPELK